jgi:hypothetical protein
MRKTLLFILLAFTIKAYNQEIKKQDDAITFLNCKQKEKISSLFFLRDLNNDNILEVVEITNQIEIESPGFLPIELSPAFDLHLIYTFDKKYNKYVLCTTSNFKIYLKEREYFYKAWYNLISNPKDLNQNLKDLVNENKKYFLKELNKLLIEVKN